MPDAEFEGRFLSGNEIYGDDFDGEELSRWFADESEAYAALGAGALSADEYGYHALNQRHGFARLPDTRFRNVLGFGSSFGGEFLPLADRIDKLTIVEPSTALVSTEIGGLRPDYVSPSPDGDLPFPDGTFDLAVCLGVLHHVPNVTRTIQELGRCVEPGGWLLLREPTVSMGDWRGPRKPGVTARERGIPADLLRRVLLGSGLVVVHEAPCAFPVTSRLGRLARRRRAFNSQALVALDHLLSKAFAWNSRYHPTRAWHKVRPVSVFFVCRKPTTEERARD
jgi:SAM-dependent methyltransferase